ncbi:hypothetical protein AVEN_216284-1 [Araneus ventricosus]|uniref:Uncharacterized protein n=1 Tax=Araneus ventricosus TaxID=182803 RepID=A0A4Y2DXX7_ARAVE|nr:hypothetical protein AVEN_10183-1 [Araneus ventricosus]GBM21728.1 hypothetical protein AVEN_19105-1 [Araneus ventricosus]GBM21810.1 hypothetical protein AVEN_182853-1 [Araneus ventricosus]GBM21819.1 hypothetical protein AVEN_216284-1 [Araneus ventricosus]
MQSQAHSNVQRTICDYPSSRGRMLRDQVYDGTKKVSEGRSHTSSCILRTKYFEVASSEEEEKAAVEVDGHPNIPDPKNIGKGSRRYDMPLNRRSRKKHELSLR